MLFVGSHSTALREFSMSGPGGSPVFSCTEDIPSDNSGLNDHGIMSPTTFSVTWNGHVSEMKSEIVCLKAFYRIPSSKRVKFWSACQ